MSIDRKQVLLWVFVLFHITSLALYIAALSVDTWSTSDVTLTYGDSSTGSGARRSEQVQFRWGLLRASLGGDGKVAQPNPRRPPLEDFSYNDCASQQVPAECDTLRAVGIGCLVLLLWAIVSAAGTASVAVIYALLSAEKSSSSSSSSLHSVVNSLFGNTYSSASRGRTAWLIVALFAAIQGAVALAAAVLWLHDGQDEIPAFCRRLFRYDADVLPAAAIPSLRLPSPDGDHPVWLSLAGMALAFASVPILYFARRAFHSDFDDSSSNAQNSSALQNDFSSPLAVVSQNTAVAAAAAANDATVRTVGSFYEMSQLQRTNPGASYRVAVPNAVTLKALREMTADQVSVWLDSLGVSDESCRTILRHDVNGRILLTTPKESIRSAFGDDSDLILETLEQVRSMPE
eukprot:TRINITY_DN5974_c0_g2_i1.p1 TRINITY_DN5974_c0_g2~~TRINITY_DN5974_c0_g2_i1.p1  ORF type:complete len:403 (+),score=71.98 TRINITY_DN5974_c0_g2_i1:43-1251(+)